MLICAWCKSVLRDDGRGGPPSHGICPDCMPQVELELLRQAQQRAAVFHGS